MSEVIKLSSPRTREYWEIPVLFEDAHLLALCKPSGLLVSPDRYDPARPNLMRLLHEGIDRGAPWARLRQLVYLANAHRLDCETSGVILLAKDKPSLIALANQFGGEKPVKRYLALVQGAPAESHGVIEANLAPHPARPQFVRVDARHGKRACTLFTVSERFAGYTLLCCQPLTGRTHQVRVHLRHRGWPLVGDALYGGQPIWLSRLKSNYRAKPDQPERPLIGRVALHAEELTVTHPATGHSVTVAAPWPKDLTVAIKYLRRHASPAPRLVAPPAVGSSCGPGAAG
jgi:RluA family pseudouridine synthase